MGAAHVKPDIHHLDVGRRAALQGVPQCTSPDPGSILVQAREPPPEDT
jgi:hypothetical protein